MKEQQHDSGHSTRIIVTICGNFISLGAIQGLIPVNCSVKEMSQPEV